MTNIRKLMTKSRQAGQTMTEYIVIVAIVAVAALALFGIFSDTLRTKLAGTVSTFDSGQNSQAAQQDVQTKSQDILKNLDATGVQSSSGS